MNGGEAPDQDLHSYLRMVLAIFAHKVQEAERKKRGDLVQEFVQTIGQETRRYLELAAEDTLRRYKNEILSTGIIEAIGQKIRESLQESKWIKWTLMTTQVFGFGAAATLLAQYEKLQLTPSARFALAVYIGCLLIALVLGILGFRSKAS